MQINHHTYIVSLTFIFLCFQVELGMACERDGMDLIQAVEKGDLKKLKKIALEEFSDDSIFDALELAVCKRDHASATYLVKETHIPLNTYLSRLQHPKDTINDAQFTLLETALIYHEDVPGKNNLPIIKLLLRHGAQITSRARQVVQLAGKESAFLVIN